MSIFEKFNQQVDVEALKNDVNEAADNTSEYREIPHGTYEVCIDKLELVMTKKEPQRPMISCWFKILTGEYANRRMFMNQIVTNGFQIYLATEFLNSLQSGVPVKCEDYVQFENCILAVRDAIAEKGLEFGVEKSDNKGYDRFTITQVFNDNEDIMDEWDTEDLLF